MKQSFTLLLSSLLLLPAGLSAQTPKDLPRRLQHRAPAERIDARAMERVKPEGKPANTVTLDLSRMMKAPKAEETVEVLYEDFSKFTKGSEDAPDATSITGGQLGDVPDSYTLQPGWNGDGIFQAGGVAYLGTASDGYPGFMTTPLVDLSSDNGTAMFSLRVRLEDGASNDIFMVMWGDDDAVQPYTYYAEVTDEWTECNVELTNCTATTVVQFYCYSSSCFIDDVRITQRDVLKTPVAVSPTDYDGTSFTASWSAVDEATSYLLSVFTVGSDGRPTEFIENFDGLVPTQGGKYYDKNQSVHSEYVEFDVSTNGTSREIYSTEGNYYSPSVSLSFDATGDYIQTIETDRDITSLSFWAKSQDASGTSRVVISLMSDGVWSDLAYLTPDIMDKGGQFVGFDDILPAGTRQLKLTYSKDAGNFAIDDFTYTVAETQTRDYFLENKEVTGTSYRVEGLDPTKEYYFTVIAKNAEKQSSESTPMLVEKVVDYLDVPEVLPATGVTPDGFTANWSEVENANYYSFYTYLAHTALKDNEQFDILNTDFSSITETGGTIDNPMLYTYTYLDQFLDRADWYAQLPAFVDGMLGISNVYADILGTPGILQSPILDLSNGGGKIMLEMSVIGIDVSSMTVQLVNALTDELIDSKQIAVSDEFTDVSCTLQGGTEQCYISIYADTGMGNLIFDDLHIWQSLALGEVTEVPYFYTETQETFTYVPVSGVRDGDVFAYCVSALYVDSDGNLDASSYFSDLMVVTGLVGLDEQVVDGRNAYVMDGRLNICNPDCEAVAVYTTDGVCTYLSSSTDTDFSIELPRAGVYVVKIGDAVFKVLR